MIKHPYKRHHMIPKIEEAIPIAVTNDGRSEGIITPPPPQADESYNESIV